MPQWDITDPDTGATLTLEGDSPPSEFELEEAFKSNRQREAAPRQGYFGAMGASLAQDAVKGVGAAAKGAEYFASTQPPLMTSDFPTAEETQLTSEWMERQRDKPAAQKLKEVQAGPIYQFGERLSQGAEEAYPVNPTQAEKFGPRVAGMIGGFIPLVASGPLAPATIGLQSLGEHLSNDFELLKEQGLSEEEAAQKTIDRAVQSGITQAALFEILPKPLAKFGEKYLANLFGKKAVAQFIAQRGSEAAQGAVLGATSAAAENVIGRRNLLEGVPESALSLGALQAATGTAGGTLRGMARKRRLNLLRRYRDERQTIRDYERVREPGLSEIIEEPTEEIYAPETRTEVTPPSTEITPEQEAAERVRLRDAQENRMAAKAEETPPTPTVEPSPTELEYGSGGEMPRQPQPQTWPIPSPREEAQRPATPPQELPGPVPEVATAKEAVPVEAEKAPGEASAEVEKGEAKEPWQMTQAEWKVAASEAGNAEIKALKSLSGSQRQKENIWGTAERLRLQYGVEAKPIRPRSVPVVTHRSVIEKALSEGKPVPPEVLADYPDLKAIAIPEPPNPKPSTERPPPPKKPTTTEAPPSDAVGEPKKWIAVITSSHRQVSKLDRFKGGATGGLPRTLGTKDRIWKVEDTPENRATAEKLGLRIHKKESEFFNSLERKHERSGSTEIPESAEPASEPQQPALSPAVEKQQRIGPATAAIVERSVASVARESSAPVFVAALRKAVEQLPQSVLDFVEARLQRGKEFPGPFVVASRMEDIPESMRHAWKTGEAVTVNHMRIQYLVNKLPTKQSLQHEIVHWGWYDLEKSRQPQIDAIAAEVEKAGDAIVEIALKRNRPEWANNWDLKLSLDALAKDVRRYRAKKYDSGQMTGIVELLLSIPDERLADIWETVHGTKPDPQTATIGIYSAVAKRMGTELHGAYAKEELVAYRVGNDDAAADRLFSREEPPAAARTAEIPPGTGMSREQALDAVRGETTRGFPVESVSKDEAVQLTGREEARNFAGFFWNGKIYLVHDNLKAGDVLGVREVLREEVGHGLLRTIEGRRLLDFALREGKFHLTPNERAKLRAEGYEERQFLDEFIAKAAREDRPWWKRLLDRVRGFLSKHGLANLTNEETARLLLKQIERTRTRNDLADASPLLPELAAARVKQERHKVFGWEGGEFYTPQKMAPIQEKLRTNYVDSTKPPTPENTVRALNIARQLADPLLSDSLRLELRSVLGPEADAGLVLLRGELADYGTKLVIAGDQSLARFLIQNWHQLATAGTTSIAEGRGLRAIQEAQTYKLYNDLAEHWFGSVEAARKALGKGDKLWDQLFRGLRELNLDPNADLGAAEIKPGKKLREALDEATGDKDAADKLEKQALRMIDEFQEADTEWLKPENRNLLRELVKRYIKPPINSTIPNQAREFITALAGELQALGLDLQKIGRPLAAEAWERRMELEATARQRAMEREAKNIADAAERTARSLADRYEMTEFPGKKAPNEIVKIIADFIKGEPGKGEPPLSDALTYEPLANLLIEAGVRPETAHRLSGDVFIDRQRKWETARAKAMQHAAERGSLRPLLERIQETPYLAQKSATWRTQAAVDFFLANGLSRDQAEAAAKAFNAEVEKKLIEAGEQLAERLLKTVVEPQTLTDLVRGIRLGLLDPNKSWSDELAKREGWKPLDEATFKRLAELEQKRNDESLSPQEFAHTIDQMMAILSQSGPSNPKGAWQLRIGEGYAMSLLSGVKTMTVQAAPVITALRDVSIASAFDIKNIPNFITAIWRAAKNVMVAEAKWTWLKDAYGFHIEAIDRSHKELRNWAERLAKEYPTASPGRKAVIRVEQLYALQRLVGRTLSTMDQAMMATAREWKLVYYSSVALRKAGLSTRDISHLIDMMAVQRQVRFEEALDAGLDPLTAKVRANSKMPMVVQEWVKNRTDSDSLANAVLRSAEADTYLYVGRRAPKSLDISGRSTEMIPERDEGFLSFPLNVFMEKMSQVRGEGGIPAIGAIALAGFTNIAIRTSRFASTFFGYGFFRYGMHRYRTTPGRRFLGLARPSAGSIAAGEPDVQSFWKQSFATHLQERARLHEAIAGVMVTAIASAWGAGHHTSDDGAGDEDFGLYFTGRGPTNKVLRDAWLKQGWKPYALNFVIGGRKAWVPLTRAGEALMAPFFIPAGLDDAAWNKKERAATGRPELPPVSNAVGSIIGATLYMSGQKGFMQQVGTLITAGQEGGGTGMIKAAAKISTGLIAAAALPFKQMLASISNMFVGPLDQSSATAIIAANFPIVGLPFQTRAVNRFGDELYDQSWSGKIFNTGVPFAFQVKKTAENEQLYQTLVAKGVAAPALLRYNAEEKYGVLSDSEFGALAKLSGEKLKRTTLNNLGMLSTAKPDDAKKWLDKAATTANREAATELGLQPLKPAKETAGGISLPGASGGGGSRPTIGTPGRVPGALRRISLGGRKRGTRLRLSRRRTGRQLSLRRLRTPKLRGFRRRGMPRLRRPRLTTA